MKGPVIDRPCGYCTEAREPLDRPCPCCDGSGVVHVDVHPFVTLEAAYEHLEGIRIAMGVIHHSELEPKMGTPFYHWQACTDALRSLVQQLIVLLPEEYERTEGS